VPPSDAPAAKKAKPEPVFAAGPSRRLADDPFSLAAAPRDRSAFLAAGSSRKVTFGI
jgi:hypothetical protein